MARKSSSKLKNILKSNWKATRKDVGKKTSAFELVPEDTYVVKNIHLELKESEEKDAIWINRKAKINSGEFKNRALMDTLGFDEKRIKYTMIFFNMLGYTE